MSDILPVRMQDFLHRRKSELREFREICQLDAAAFYLTAADLAGALREKGIMFYIDSPATSTLTAYLTGLTEIDPLPPHYSCPVCGRTSFIS